jgi:hypothetical protein
MEQPKPNKISSSINKVNKVSKVNEISDKLCDFVDYLLFKPLKEMKRIKKCFGTKLSDKNIQNILIFIYKYLKDEELEFYIIDYGKEKSGIKRLRFQYTNKYSWDNDKIGSSIFVVLKRNFIKLKYVKTSI